MTQIIDGKLISAKIKNELTNQVSALSTKPKLAVISVGDDAASAVYVRGKSHDANEIGINFELFSFDSTTPEEEILDTIDHLNADQSVDGIIVQLPLPAHYNETRLTNSVSPEKDVDGFHPINVGNLNIGCPTPGTLPCTAAGVLDLLRGYDIEMQGKSALVIGRSNIVGKPTAALLTSENATVTLAHSKTPDETLRSLVSESDIIVCAVGYPHLLDASFNYLPSTTIIDVGINRDSNNKLCGDVDMNALINENRVAFISPVPGGVGLMTRAELMKNVVTRHLINNQ